MARVELRRDLGAALSADPANRAVLRARAEVALEAARAASPSRTFTERLSLEETEKGPALVVRWSLWDIIEYGSVNNPPYAPLRRGVEAAGLHMTDPRAGG